MKLRIKGNTLRYRLTKTDLAIFAANGYLEDVINFAGQTLTYALQQNNGEQLTARFNNHVITMYMPFAMVNEWADTDKVGYENTDGELYLLIEKDFKCLDEVAEDQSDNYPNPLSKN